MATQVKVTSIDALEAFRANLIIFLTQAHRSVDEVHDEVRRLRHWLQQDQRMFWEGQARKWRKTLDQAQQELMSARLSALRDSTSAQEMAVLKAKRALTEAEEKLRKVKLWNRDFDSQADPLIKRMDGLRHLLDYDLPKALAYLVQAQRTLDAYTEIPAPQTTVTPSSEARDSAPSLPAEPPTA